MYKALNFLMSVVLVATIFTSCSNKVNIYVSPQGNDTNPGTKELPLASLNGAKNYVRNLKSETNGDINVWLRDGEYRLNKTVVFGLEDSGEGESIIRYQAYPNEKPVFTSDVTIEGWEKLDDTIPQLPKAAIGNIWVTKVSKLEGVPSKFYTLYDAEGRLPRARSKGFIPTVTPGTLVKEHDRDVLYYPPGIIKNWPNLSDVEIITRTRQGWMMNMLQLESVDEEANIATTVFPATYLMEELHLLPEVENTWVENVIEALDEPGEWVLNTLEGKLYLWARDSEKPKGIVAPTLQEYILVSGKEDAAGDADKPVRNLSFEGLTFMHGERYTWEGNDKGLQHDWDMYDKANALIRFRVAENCVVEQCHFVQSGGTAIRLDLYGQHIKIQNNRIEHVGATGILLCGYNPGSKDVNKNNLVYNNHISNVGDIYWHSPAIFIWQSGTNRIANNLIHNTPYAGVVISGLLDRFDTRAVYKEMDLSNPFENSVEADETYHFSRDNIVEHNEIHNGMEVIADGNGIYLRGAGVGNIIRQNYIHDFLAQKIVMQGGIRTDGLQKGTLITHNVIYNFVSHGIHLKHNNRAENNIIAGIRDAFHKGKVMPATSFKLRSGPLTGGSIKNNILYQPVGDVVFYEQGVGKDPLGMAWAKEADTDFNIYYSGDHPELAKQFLTTNQQEGIDENSLVADPFFVDYEKGNFKLNREGQALKLGIESLDVSIMGLKK